MLLSLHTITCKYSGVITYFCQPRREGQSLIACKCPQLPRTGGDVRHTSKGSHRDHDRSHRSRATFAARAIVKHLDERLASWCSKDLFDISNHHTEGHQHDKTHRTVDDHSSYHSARKGLAGISELLSHMCSGIGPDKGEDGREHTDETGEADGAPTSAIYEGGKDLRCIAALAENPQWDQDGEETADVQDQNNALNERQLAG